MDELTNVISTDRSRPWLFFALAYGWSWLFWIPAALWGRSVQTFPAALLLYLGGLGPPLAAIVLTCRTQDRAGRRDFWRRVIDVRRIGAGWSGVIMKAAFGLLVDTTVHNFMRRLAVDINERYRTGFKAAVLPPHISLKQPFQISSLAGVEAYFDQLAQSVEPFEITLTHLELQIVSLDDGEQGVLWLAVREDHALRRLHQRINLKP